MKPVVISKKAEKDLAEVFEYSLATWSRNKARQYLADLQFGLQQLQEGNIKGKQIIVNGRIIRRLHIGRHYAYHHVSRSQIEGLRIALD